MWWLLAKSVLTTTVKSLCRPPAIIFLELNPAAEVYASDEFPPFTSPDLQITLKAADGTRATLVPTAFLCEGDVCVQWQTGATLGTWAVPIPRDGHDVQVIHTVAWAGHSWTTVRNSTFQETLCGKPFTEYYKSDSHVFVDTPVISGGEVPT